ncbi:MAG: 1-acyl-sn-glycerol-3-phosphate acyltransferase [Bacteroidetes bacterium]|nr:1-acyl-sn-glycerol-3-phosphate acyltransferase [Bacteroidota bacterium]
MEVQHEQTAGGKVADGRAMRRKVPVWLFALPRLVFKLWFVLVFLLSMLLLYLPFKVLLRRPSRYPAAFKLMRAWATFLNVFLLVPVSVRREAPLPPQPYVVCMNHGSYLDIIHAFNVLPDYFLFMGKYELLRWPLFRIFFKGMHIAVNRGSRTSAARAFLKAGQALDRGVSVCIFPEGTIPYSVPRMKSFKDGAFRLAVEKQVPILPITFLDNWRLFGDPETLLSRGHPGRARVVVHAAVPTKGLGPEDIGNLRRRVFEAIEGPLRGEFPNS